MNAIAPFEKLRMYAADLIVADVPLDFDNYSDKGTAKGADPHYEVMPLEEICELPVGHLCGPNTLLLFWTTGWGIATGQAQKIVISWGFKPISEIIWRKVTKSGKPRMGTGYRVRTQHEPILLCTLGNPKHKPFRSEFAGVAREHSRKPEEFYAMVERCCPRLTNRLDLFSRQSRPGWIGWGKEARKFDIELTGAAESAHTQACSGSLLENLPLEKDRPLTRAAPSPAGQQHGSLFETQNT